MPKTMALIASAVLSALGPVWLFFFFWLRHRSWLRHRHTGFAPPTQHLLMIGLVGWLLFVIAAITILVLIQ
jgi:hypothetical protein